MWPVSGNSLKNVDQILRKSYFADGKSLEYFIFFFIRNVLEGVKWFVVKTEKLSSGWYRNNSKGLFSEIYVNAVLKGDLSTISPLRLWWNSSCFTVSARTFYLNTGCRERRDDVE